MQVSQRIAKVSIVLNAILLIAVVAIGFDDYRRKTAAEQALQRSIELNEQAEAEAKRATEQAQSAQTKKETEIGEE